MQMKCFIDEEQRRAMGSTCFFEFQKGKFKNKHWRADSIFLHADIFDSLGLYALFSGAIQDFCYYAPNEVNREQWCDLVAKSKEKEDWENLMEELRPWAEECFAANHCFTICGI